MLLRNEQITVYRKEGMFDYIFAEDTAEGLIRLAQSDAAEGVINLGTGKARKVSDVIDILKGHFPLLTYVEKDEEASIPYEASQAKISKLWQLTQWRPQYSLEESISEIVNYERSKVGKRSVQQTEKGPFNVLITSVSKKIPLITCIRKAQKTVDPKGRLYGGDANHNCLGKYFVDTFYPMPTLEEDRIESIVEYCMRNDIKAIVPTRDGELLYWAIHKAHLATHGINVMVSHTDAIENTLDKLRFYELGKSLGFPVIETSLDSSELTSANLVVKERFGAGSASIGLGLTQNEALLHGKGLKQPIYQPFVKGLEYSVDLFITSSFELKGAVSRSRDIVVGGESQVTTTCAQPVLEEICTAFALKLKLSGHIIFQVIEDLNGSFQIIECNPRFGGASTLSVESGLSSFYWYFLECQGVDVSPYPFSRKASGLKQIRIPADQYMGSEV
jgi:carbamoyl-phosphate synthase large subunit